MYVPAPIIDDRRSIIRSSVMPLLLSRLSPMLRLLLLSAVLINRQAQSFHPSNNFVQSSRRSSYLVKPKTASGDNDYETIVHDYTLCERNPYDVHVYYTDATSRDEAMVMREKMQTQFPWMRFYAPKDRPIGPHPTPMWEADFGHYDNRHRWNDVRRFIDTKHGNLSALIHPHSTDSDYDDHTKNAYWVGEVMGLRIRGWKR